MAPKIVRLVLLQVMFVLCTAYELPSQAWGQGHKVHRVHYVLDLFPGQVLMKSDGFCWVYFGWEMICQEWSERWQIPDCQKRQRHFEDPRGAAAPQLNTPAELECSEEIRQRKLHFKGPKCGWSPPQHSAPCISALQLNNISMQTEEKKNPTNKPKQRTNWKQSCDFRRHILMYLQFYELPKQA